MLVDALTSLNERTDGQSGMALGLPAQTDTDEARRAERSPIRFRAMLR